MKRVYIYVIARDYGFAPNPFHGMCTLATCKPVIRNTAKIGDWIFGVGGSKLKATGRCIFAMKVTEKVTFNEYWSNIKYADKIPVRNGSKRMIIGDNIYHQNPVNQEWEQAASHHSHPDGSTNTHNLKRDTGSNYVLISAHFYYFGKKAPQVPQHIFDELGYYNKIAHRVFQYSEAKALINWLETNYEASLNIVQADPFNFDKSNAHYSVENNRIIISQNNSA